MRPTKEEFQRWREGHQWANRVIEEERRDRLPRLTQEESLREYAELCRVWESFGKRSLSPEAAKRLDQMKLRDLLERRGKLDRAAGRTPG